MSQDFGWRRPGEGYVKAYDRALALRALQTRQQLNAP